MKISICTQLLDWNFGLREALPTWLKLPCDEIVIFDYNCGKESAKEVIDLNPDPRIKLYVPVHPLKYHHSIGRNIVINATNGDLIFYLDSDIKVMKSLDFNKIDKTKFLKGCKFYGQDKYMPSVVGSCIFWKEQYLKVNGYDERMNGWGSFDMDFYNRLIKAGYSNMDFESGLFVHVDHDDIMRTKNFDVKDKQEATIYNSSVSEIPWGVCFKQSEHKIRLVDL